MLLYAQPVSRLIRLTTDDIIIDDEDIGLRLGDPPSPVPEPFAELLLRLRDERRDMNTDLPSLSRSRFG
ncbi:hypothetical protein AB0M47_39195 [Hamadaea sp. NPDC051192]|uniref:hypothetical protein n=1 Tax=Hamadaea sp. NPDC051192 TaxID=3154940 RepID=UPI003415A731